MPRLDSFDRSAKGEFVRSPLQERNQAEDVLNGRIGYLQVWAMLLGFGTLYRNINDPDPEYPETVYRVLEYSGQATYLAGNPDGPGHGSATWRKDYLEVAPLVLPEIPEPRFTMIQLDGFNEQTPFVTFNASLRVEVTGITVGTDLFYDVQAYSRITGELVAFGSEQVRLTGPINAETIRAALSQRADVLWLDQAQPALEVEDLPGGRFWDIQYESLTSLSESAFKRSYYADVDGTVVGPAAGPGGGPRGSFAQDVPRQNNYQVRFGVGAFLSTRLIQTRIAVIRGRVPASRVQGLLWEGTSIPPLLTEVSCQRFATGFPQFVDLIIPGAPMPRSVDPLVIRTTERLLFWTVPRQTDFLGTILDIPAETITVPASC